MTLELRNGGVQSQGFCRLSECLDKQYRFQHLLEHSLDGICNKNKLRLFPSVSATVEPHSAEVLVRILLIQEANMCERKVTASAITFSFPLTTHVNLCDLHQLTDLQDKK